MAFTPKQKAFVAEYLVDLNATAAAKRAGYSPRTARSQGQRLLTNVDIQAAVQQAIREREERVEITQDYVLRELKKISGKAASDAPDGELRYANKLRALELLGKHLGIFDRGGPAGDASSLDAFLKAVHATPEEVAALYAEENE